MTILRLYAFYKPLHFFGIISVILGLIFCGLFIPVFMTYLDTGLVPNFPTLIVSGFILLTGIISFFNGVLLQSLRHKDRQDFEWKLISINTRKER